MTIMLTVTMMGALVLRREQVRLHNDSIKIGEREALPTSLHSASLCVAYHEWSRVPYIADNFLVKWFLNIALAHILGGGLRRPSDGDRSLVFSNAAYA